MLKRVKRKNKFCSVSLNGKALDFESKDEGSIPSQSKWHFSFISLKLDIGKMILLLSIDIGSNPI